MNCATVVFILGYHRQVVVAAVVVVIMDDLFGKDDSTNEDSDAAIDMDSSYENQAQREPKDSGDNGMDIDVMEQVVKVSCQDFFFSFYPKTL